MRIDLRNTMEGRRQPRSLGFDAAKSYNEAASQRCCCPHDLGPPHQLVTAYAKLATLPIQGSGFQPFPPS